MKLEKFKQAIKGQKTVRLEFPHLSRKLEVSDIKVGESGLLIYTYWDSDVCREVLTRVSEVVEVKPVEDKPEEGKQYLLIGGTDKPSIANGNSWAESEVKS
tara:strand:- start:54 stop:356 length:303 start_codon:yes stop_codon:yes gene_type:complete